MSEIDNSSDNFQSILVFPYLQVEKHKAWRVVLSVAERVFFYVYPFYLPEQFLIPKNSNDLRVKTFFILSFASVNVNKQFQVQNLVEQYDSSRQKTTLLKHEIIRTFNEAQSSKLIETSLQLVLKTGEIKFVDKLDIYSLSKTETIIYNEVI